MTIHEKARMYTSLEEDIIKFISVLEEHYKYVEEIGADETGKGEASYYPMKVGRLLGTNFSLDIEIRRMQDTINWYKRLK